MIDKKIAKYIACNGFMLPLTNGLPFVLSMTESIRWSMTWLIIAAADAAKPIPKLASRIKSYCNSLPCANSIPTIAVNIMSKFTLGFVSETNSQITTDSLDCDDDDVVEFSMT